MPTSTFKKLCGGIAAAVFALALIGCKGADGKAGINGTNGTNGTDGTNGTNGTNATVTINAAQLTPDEWSQLNFQGSITSVTMGGAPVVNFKVTNDLGTPIKGLAFSSKNSTASYARYQNFGFTLAKLVPGTNGDPSKWVDYIVIQAPKTSDAGPIARLASYENYGTLVDNGDGSYQYTFRNDITQIKTIVDGLTYTAPKARVDLGDVSYEPNLTHRLGIFIGGNAPGTGTMTPTEANSGIPSVPKKTAANLVYDFIPATGAAVTATDEQRNIVDVKACQSCHTKLEFHGGNRVDPRFCVICHTDQLKYGQPEGITTNRINGFAVADFPNFIHRIHMGEGLKTPGTLVWGIPVNEHTYPQDQRNCVKCHTASNPATPQGDNWFNKPNMMACGGCHDAINWATGDNHIGGPQINNQQCSVCHPADVIKINHIPAVAPNPGFSATSHTNGSTVAAFTDHLPLGATINTWDLKTVALDASQHPVFTFRFLRDGAPVVFNTFGAGVTELMDNYVGGPQVYLAFGVPQDGITAPEDFNATASAAIRSVWSGSVAGATFAGPDANGYYTITLGAATVPAGATHITGGIGFQYGGFNSQPLTQTNVSGYPYDATTKVGGLSVPAPNVTKVATGSTARRAIVTTAKCNDCHAKLGVFTDAVFHAGERNEATACTFCHNVNRVNNGWGVNIKDAVHAIHSADKRVNKFSWEAGAGLAYWNIGYPGILNNCEACHVPGSYDFGLSANANAVPNLLWTTVARGVVPNPVNVIVTGDETLPGTYWSPFVTAGADYGTVFSFSAATGVTTPAAATTLVNSPITSSCSSCHDSKIAIAHMTGNGGAFYEARSTAFTKVEQCMICHASGKTADIRKVHMTFK